MEIRIVIDDRIVSVLKRLTSRKVLAIVGGLLVAVPLVVYGAVPYVFENGTVIYAEKMNANFEDLDGRIAPYESAIHVDEETGNVGIGTMEPKLAVHVASGTYGNPAGSGTTPVGYMRLRSPTTTAVLDFGTSSSVNGSWLQSTDEGLIYYSEGANAPCFCDGSGWKRFSDNTTCP